MEENLKLSQQVCFPIYALAKEVVSMYRPHLESLDLTYPQYLVMLVLWEEETQSVSQLGEKLLLDSGTLTPLLKRLEQKNLVHRTRGKIDERVVHVTLSERGKTLKQEALCIPEQLISSLNVSLEELKMLREITKKILHNT